MNQETSIKIPVLITSFTTPLSHQGLRKEPAIKIYLMSDAYLKLLSSYDHKTMAHVSHYPTQLNIFHTSIHFR
jgi:hypothetical protein